MLMHPSFDLSSPTPHTVSLLVPPSVSKRAVSVAAVELDKNVTSVDIGFADAAVAAAHHLQPTEPPVPPPTTDTPQVRGPSASPATIPALIRASVVSPKPDLGGLRVSVTPSSVRSADSLHFSALHDPPQHTNVLSSALSSSQLPGIAAVSVSSPLSALSRSDSGFHAPDDLPAPEGQDGSDVSDNGEDNDGDVHTQGELDDVSTVGAGSVATERTPSVGKGVVAGTVAPDSPVTRRTSILSFRSQQSAHSEDLHVNTLDVVDLSAITSSPSGLDVAVTPGSRTLATSASSVNGDAASVGNSRAPPVGSATSQASGDMSTHTVVIRGHGGGLLSGVASQDDSDSATEPGDVHSEEDFGSDNDGARTVEGPDGQEDDGNSDGDDADGRDAVAMILEDVLAAGSVKSSGSRQNTLDRHPASAASSDYHDGNSRRSADSVDQNHGFGVLPEASATVRQAGDAGSYGSGMNDSRSGLSGARGGDGHNGEDDDDDDDVVTLSNSGSGYSDSDSGGSHKSAERKAAESAHGDSSGDEGGKRSANDEWIDFFFSNAELVWEKFPVRGATPDRLTRFAMQAPVVIPGLYAAVCFAVFSTLCNPTCRTSPRTHVAS